MHVWNFVYIFFLTMAYVERLWIWILWKWKWQLCQKYSTLLTNYTKQWTSNSWCIALEILIERCSTKCSLYAINAIHNCLSIFALNIRVYTSIFNLQQKKTKKKHVQWPVYPMDPILATSLNLQLWNFDLEFLMSGTE